MATSIELVRQLIADIKAATWMLVSCAVYRHQNGTCFIFCDYSAVQSLIEAHAPEKEVLAAIANTERVCGKWFVEKNHVYRIPDMKLFLQSQDDMAISKQAQKCMGKMTEEAFFALCESLVANQMKKIGIDVEEVAKQLAPLGTVSPATE